MISLWKKIRNILTAAERREAGWLFILTFVMAVTEIIGIASILPFIAVLASPDIVQTNPYLRSVYEYLGLSSVNHYLFLLGVGVLLLLVLGNAVKAYARWKMLGFSVMAGHTISSRLFRQYLHQPYAYFLEHNSSHLSKNILMEVHSLVANVVTPFVEVVARIIIITAILALLMAVDPLLATIVGSILGGIFAAVYFSMRHWLHRIGKERVEAQNQRFQIVNEALMGIKNIKLTGNEHTYTALYERPSLVYSRTTALSSVAGEIPRYAIEVIAFGGILMIVLYLLLQKQGLSNALPLISLYAVSGYRLMPSLQALLQSYSKIRFNISVLDYLQKEIALAVQTYSAHDGRDIPALPFEREIEFRNVSFRYERGHKNVLENINFTLRKNDTMGLVGKTGSGKTTAVDLLLGLLNATSGEILIDGVALTDETRRAWQKNCAYVTQHIYLCDDTMRANIAFGIPKDQVDEDMMRRAAKMAAIDTMIEELPEKYDAQIGENGVRLSGGQRQRIGLARALYLNRPVLVLDEATSALDDATEREVMQAIDNLAEQKTIIIIAHRLQTLKNADHIVDLGANMQAEPLKVADQRA